jgi:hypothetical protein
MLDHFRAFQGASGDGNWTRVLDRAMTVIAAIQQNHSPTTGLIPDFVIQAGSNPAPSPPSRFESAYDGHYYWNACRVPLRLGADHALFGDGRAATALSRMTTFFRAKTGDQPGNLAAGYLLSGAAIDTWAARAFIAPMAVGAMHSAQNQTFVNRAWDRLIAFGAPDGDYYGDNLKLLSLIVLSGNYWSPQTQVVAGGVGVALHSPLSGARFSAPATIAMGATTTGTVARVEFYANSQLVGTDSAAPFAYNFANVAAGRYTLVAKAIGASGQSATSAAISIRVR